ncbi:MAG: glutamate--tRNA ligase family protein, partial [Lachnobacterium sp.]|nr:glutamate--tRNA ligase family protein [Lachnobacterium sp.]MDD7712893.1 glutamate--tRNA ligase family protein [Lachnobacterium sp.]
MKIKFKDLGIRVVYKVERVSDVMRVIVISSRTDEQVYQEAAKRKDQYGAFHVAITPFMVYNTRYDKKGENIAMSKVRTRFAPSPTGRMHVGNLR